MAKQTDDAEGGNNAKAAKFKWNGSGDKKAKKAAWEKAEALRVERGAGRDARRAQNRVG